MSADKLVRLPDGTWVRPSEVVSVTALHARTSAVNAEPLPARVDVRVDHPHGSFILTAIDVESTAAARELCDQIGRIIADAEDDEAKEDADDERD